MVANVTTAPAADDSSKDENGVPRYIAVTTSPDFYAAIKAAADKENVAPSTWIKQLVAAKLEFVLTDTPRSKYATEAEKKAAQKSARISKQEQVHILFIAHFTNMLKAAEEADDKAGIIDAKARIAREEKLLAKMREKAAADGE